MNKNIIELKDENIYTSFAINGKSYIVFSLTANEEEGEIIIFGKLNYLDDGTRFITNLNEEEYNEAITKYQELIELAKEEGEMSWE